MSIDHIVKRISKAKTSLILEHPFFGHIAMSMPVHISEQVPTAATDGKCVIFNPEYIDKQTDEEVIFLVAHECMHPMSEHNYRRNGRDRHRWNMAGDYVINKLLVDEGIGKMPNGGLHSDEIYQAGGGTTEGIYSILPEVPEDQRGFGGDGQPLDDCQDGGETPAELAQKQAEWRVKVAQAAQTAKMMGKLSAGLERMVGEILQPKVDWRHVLRNFVEKSRTDERTWARPNRRFTQQGMYVPSISGETLGEIAFAVDCSGSIGPDIVDQFAAEIRTVQEDSKPSRIHVVYFDSEVSHYETYGRDDSLDIKPHGGGGTAFSPVFKYMDEHGITPSACVFLTDLYCSDFGDVPDYPVLWVTTDQTKAPFGDVVEMNH